ncbi:hypothetical protein HaLaN_29804 [Haematococcus lacustris]|uniref:Uncharacterized protein n=1 Tax=Haematococcus lacustris TaxID=44745 RepID=A0A6A0ADW5_HAELA|nr:hypothetical protein HaLaN_29804 [Haematococcus lacustris]
MEPLHACGESQGKTSKSRSTSGEERKHSWARLSGLPLLPLVITVPTKLIQQGTTCWPAVSHALQPDQQNSFNKEQHVGLWVISLRYNHIEASSVAPLMTAKPTPVALVQGANPP